MSASPFKVLWVYQTVQHGAMKKYEAGQKPSLCFKGRKHMFCVSAGHPVRVLKREASDFDKLRPVMHDKVLYEPLDAAKKFREIADRCGITEAAKKILARAESEAPRVDDFSDDDFTNEEETTMTTTKDDTAVTAEGETAAQPKEKTVKAKKEKKAKAPAKAKVAKAKAPAKTKAAKVAKVKDPLGKEGSLTRFMNEHLVKGEDNAKISAAAKKAFPKSSTTDPSHVSWYRWSAGKKGIIKG